MDKKEKVIMQRVLLTLVYALSAFMLNAQDVKKVQFCDAKYEYGEGKDSITLFLKVLDSDNNRSTEITPKNLEDYLVIKEEGNIIPNNKRVIRSLSSGQRIPNNYIFSVLIDQSIPDSGKGQIFDAVKTLVESAPDSSVYISFFGDEVTSSRVVTKDTYKDLQPLFHISTSNKYFYGALFSKLAEFNAATSELESSIRVQPGYSKNSDLIRKSSMEGANVLLFVFTEGNKRPEDETITFIQVTDYEADTSHFVPRVYAFYYTGEGIDENVKQALEGVTTPRDFNNNILNDRRGDYKPSDNISNVLSDFEKVVNDAMYDFAFIYQVDGDKSYSGRTHFTAEYKSEDKGQGEYSIGTAENPWPVRVETALDIVMKYLMAIFITILTILFFFFVMKILIPFIKSKSFAVKYYKKYEPEANVQRRICHYCKQDIQPGQTVVARCKHVMHVYCWQQNGYKCAEYGQNCKTGIQDHVEWRDLFTMRSFRECHQTIAGICAGLISWIIYELSGRGMFSSVAAGITKTFYTNHEQLSNLFDVCVVKVSSFLTIGFLLGFFLSLIFRYNDEYRNRDWKVYMKIIGLSLLSGIIGLISFAIGGIILCILLSMMGTTYIPWYCSFPAYLLFSICTSLSLTIKSSIPVKSAMIGGLCSSVIGFIVLYLSSVLSAKHGVLLDFVIYGGGLGASLVTVRMLAEKYFLVIQNGVKAGQKIPIHKWMNATGGGNKVSIGMTGECEIQMNWEKGNKVAKEHAQLYVDHSRSLPMIKPLATGVVYNTRAELPVGKPCVLSNGDTFKIGDTIFQYVETD